VYCTIDYQISPFPCSEGVHFGEIFRIEIQRRALQGRNGGWGEAGRPLSVFLRAQRMGRRGTRSKGMSAEGLLVARIGADGSIGKQREEHNVSLTRALMAGLATFRPVGLPEAIGEDVVLSFLTLRDALRARRVSSEVKRWIDANLSRRELIVLENCDIDDAGFLRVLKLCPNALELALNELPNLKFSAELAGHIANSTLSTQVRKLRILQCGNPKAVEKLLKSFTSLVDVQSDMLSDVTLKVLGETSGSRLQVLSCRDGGNRVTGRGLLLMAASAPLLAHIDMSWCALGDEHLLALANCPSIRTNLISLNISGCCDIRDNENNHRLFRLTEEGVADAISRLQGLQDFSCQGLHPEGPVLRAISERKRFRALRLGNCPRLETVEEFRDMLQANGPTLRVFEFKGNRTVPDLSGFCDSIKHLSSLTELALSSCEGVSDIVAQTIATNCKQLRKVILKRTNALTDVGIRFIAEGCQSLEHLDLTGCQRVGDKTLQHLSACNELRILTLYCCSSVSDEGLLRALGADIDFLKSEGADEELCHGEGSIASAALLRNDFWSNSTSWPKLEELDLSWCFRVSSQCFTNVAKRSPALRRIVLEGFDHFTPMDIDRIQFFGPRVHIFMHRRDSDDDLDRHIQHLHRMNAIGGEKNRQVVAKEPCTPASGGKSRIKRRSAGGSGRRLLLYYPGASPRRDSRGSSFSQSPPATESLTSTSLNSSQGGKGFVPMLTRRVSLEELEVIAKPHEPLESTTNRPRAYSEALMGKKVELDKHRQRRFGDTEQDESRLTAFASLHEY